MSRNSSIVWENQQRQIPTFNEDYLYFLENNKAKIYECKRECLLRLAFCI